MTRDVNSRGESIGVIACGAIATHIGNVALKHDLDITIYPLSSLLHNSPKKIAGEVDELLQSIKANHQKCVVAYADCGTFGALDEVIARHGVSRLAGNLCYDIFAGAGQIAEIMESQAGTYFLTDFLVTTFQLSVIVELGLDLRPELRDDYFKNYSRVIWLAQNPTSELLDAATAAAKQIGLPLEVRDVGESGLEREFLALLK